MSLQTRISFEFSSFDEFARFVELIRGKEIDLKEIRKLTREIDSSDDYLSKAIQEGEKKNG